MIVYDLDTVKYDSISDDRIRSTVNGIVTGAVNDAGASHYLPSQSPPPHNRVKDDFPNESTTVDHDNYTSAIQTTADTSPNYGILITPPPPLPTHSTNYDFSKNPSTTTSDPIHDDDFPPET
ncbi:unnamed protein product [Rotaria socialis]|uniref:Uncharacterized protein n=1 Tax=Rotaria socialis TaxID=392032 RepID=A0A820L3P8_9BILA|nr:unnamed protein product [Rotaria socialis]